ncbi:MAG TPA: hypothetical protein VNC84_02925 [Gammaproteobacteria bacterium]|nr:hypothetical protein [Gammaproteobacteria bacterium]
MIEPKAIDVILTKPMATHAVVVDNVRYTVPITDHRPVGHDTKAGLMVALNIWCPGSPIAPSFVEKLGLPSRFCIVDPADQQSQMILMAAYLVALSQAGVVAFMLQEVPSPQSMNFTILMEEIERLSPGRLDIVTMVNSYRPTMGTRSGTCVLLDKSKVHYAADQSDVLEIDLKNRGGIYVLQMQEGDRFQVVNLHGDYAHPKETFRIIDEAIKAKCMVCGDWNIKKNASHVLHQFEQYGHSEANDPLETLDGFYDAT